MDIFCQKWTSIGVVQQASSSGKPNNAFVKSQKKMDSAAHSIPPQKSKEGFQWIQGTWLLKNSEEFINLG